MKTSLDPNQRTLWLLKPREVTLKLAFSVIAYYLRLAKRRNKARQGSFFKLERISPCALGIEQLELSIESKLRYIRADFKHLERMEKTENQTLDHLRGRDNNKTPGRNSLGRGMRP